VDVSFAPCGDYSRWFNEVIKDKEAGEETEKVEQSDSAGARNSRELIRAAIEKRYTTEAQR